MKIPYLNISAAVLFGLLVIPHPLFGQVPVQTTTTVTSSGTVSDFTPNAIAVKLSTSPVPVHYSFTKTTTYVDENGNPVSVETVKSGVPVTVYYEKNDNGFVADKVVVRKQVSTTTTDASAPAPAMTPPSAEGFVADADSDSIALRTSSSGHPVHYQVHDATAFVDENGNPVAKNGLKEGTPITIFYERDGDSLRATRVIVKNNPAVIERKTTTTETTVPQ